MSHAELFPIDAVICLGAAQMGEQTMAQLANRNRSLVSPVLEQLGRRSVADQVKGAICQRERWPLCEELNFCERDQPTPRAGAEGRPPNP